MVIGLCHGKQRLQKIDRRMTKREILIIIGALLVGIGFIYLAHGSSNSSNSNMTLDCLRMFYSDSWNKGYVSSLAEFCGSKK